MARGDPRSSGTVMVELLCIIALRNGISGQAGLELCRSERSLCQLISTYRQGNAYSCLASLSSQPALEGSCSVRLLLSLTYSIGAGSLSSGGGGADDDDDDVHLTHQISKPTIVQPVLSQ